MKCNPGHLITDNTKRIIEKSVEYYPLETAWFKEFADENGVIIHG